MKVYTTVIIDIASGKHLHEESFEYFGPVSHSLEILMTGGASMLGEAALPAVLGASAAVPATATAAAIPGVSALGMSAGTLGSIGSIFGGGAGTLAHNAMFPNKTMPIGLGLGAGALRGPTPQMLSGLLGNQANSPLYKSLWDAVLGNKEGQENLDPTGKQDTPEEMMRRYKSLNPSNFSLEGSNRPPYSIYSEEDKLDDMIKRYRGSGQYSVLG